MGKHRHDRSRKQRQLRRRRGERAFLFDKSLGRLLADVPRDDWEFAISVCGGDVALAGRTCGLADVPRSAKALWGRSPDEALGTYRRWQKRRRK